MVLALLLPKAGDIRDVGSISGLGRSIAVAKGSETTKVTEHYLIY